MSSMERLNLIVNDSCRTIIVLLLNNILNVFYEFLKFTLVLLLCHIVAYWIFRFFNNVLPAFPRTIIQQQRTAALNNSYNKNANLDYVDSEDLETEMEELQNAEAELERFITAELRNSQLSSEIKARSSYFEQMHKQSNQKSEIKAETPHTSQSEQFKRDELDSKGSPTQENSKPKNSSFEDVNTESKTKPNTSLKTIESSDNPMNKAAKQRNGSVSATDENANVQSYDDQADHESFHRV